MLGLAPYFITGNSKIVSKALVGHWNAHGKLMFTDPIDNKTETVPLSHDVKCMLLSSSNLKCTIKNFKVNGELQPIEATADVTVRGNGLTLQNATTGEEYFKGDYNSMVDKVYWESADSFIEYFWIRSMLYIYHGKNITVFKLHLGYCT